MIANENARRLAALGGTEPVLKNIPADEPRGNMILVDTSVWMDHLRRGNNDLVTLLESLRVLIHRLSSVNWPASILKTALQLLICYKLISHSIAV